ncbi:MAG: hypothetical protein H6723_01505 [Sandaracinus sp.]|nr:hypothetical protein [Sandaracinus sp.]
MSDARVSPVDVRLRVVAIALEPALTLARIAALPLDDLQRLVAAGYFRDARSRGLSFRAIARRFDKSLRTITNLSNLANEQGVPLQSSQRLTWRRQLVQLAASKRGGVAEKSLLSSVPDADAEALTEELVQLLDEGILERDGERVRVVARHLDLVQDDLAPRLESLRHFLRAVAAVAYRRFFVADPDAEAFARVLSFSASREQLATLRELAYGVLRERVFEADANAGEDPARAVAVFALAEEPDDLAWRPPRGE